MQGVQDDEVLIDIQQGTIGLKFEWLSDAKLVLTDELIAESLKGRKEFVESDFDTVEEEES